MVTVVVGMVVMITVVVYVVGAAVVVMCFDVTVVVGVYLDAGVDVYVDDDDGGVVRLGAAVDTGSCDVSGVIAEAVACVGVIDTVALNASIVVY